MNRGIVCSIEHEMSNSFTALILVCLILILLFSHKQRVLATIFLVLFLKFYGYATERCSQGMYAISMNILFVVIYASLFITSFAPIDNIWLLYVIHAIAPFVGIKIFLMWFTRSNKQVGEK